MTIYMPYPAADTDLCRPDQQAMRRVIGMALLEANGELPQPWWRRMLR